MRGAFSEVHPRRACSCPQGKGTSVSGGFGYDTGAVFLRHQGKLPAWGRQDERPQELSPAKSAASQALGQ